MFTNYLRIAWRTLNKSKFYSALNIAGLTFGLTWFILIGLFLFDELTFDRHHRNHERIYRLVEHISTPTEKIVVAAGSYQLAEQSKSKVPGIENTTRLQRMGRANLINPENPVNFQEDVTVADERFLQIFDFTLIEGDARNALAEPNSIVINEDLAKRLFGTTEALGKSVEFGFLNSPLKVTGLLKNHPSNSSFTFNSLLSAATFENDQFLQDAGNDWLSSNYSVYLLLNPTADAKKVTVDLKNLVQKNFDAPKGTQFSLSLQPLKDMHLKSEGILDGARNTNVEAMPEGSMFYIRVFAFIAIFVLAIAGINYMNLTTARASNRLKEIGVRKSVGALRGHLVRQFLFESMLITAISFVLAVACVNLFLPAFNEFTKKQLSFGVSSDYRIWLLAVLFGVLTGLLSGSYPAIMLSRFKPILLLRGFSISNKYDLSLRKVLVVFQFTTSVVMIVATLVLVLQVRFLKTSDLGFNKELLVVIDVNTGKARENYRHLKSEMLKVPTVNSVSVTSRVPGEWKSYRFIKLNKSGSAGEPLSSYMIGADQDFVKTFGIQVVSGRNFINDNDSASVILNETAARMLNINEASGQIVEIPAVAGTKGAAFQPVNEENTPFIARVVGIARDFHFQSLREKIEPLVLTYSLNPIQSIDYYTARIQPTDISGTLEQLKKVMVNNDSNDPFEYHFLDDQLARFYIEDTKRQTLLMWASAAMVIIACLGLFGLATFSANQRVKEIGIRKVLGASATHLAGLLSRDFLKLVLIANGLAFPIAWWATHKWLQEYAYHIDVQWWVFAVAGVAAIIIALSTVIYQALKAAAANPVASLRTE